MKTPATTDQKVRPTHYKRRVSAKVRIAIKQRIEKADTWAACAEAAGLAQSSLYKALNQTHVKEMMQDLKDKYCQQVEGLEIIHKARAMEVARELLDSSASDTVKARMVEFFRAETKGPSVAIQVNTEQSGPNAANQPSRGYEYLRPGQELVRIVTPDRPAQPDIIDVEFEQD